MSDNSTSKPKLNALVLLGGKSTRMGMDKSQLVYYNQPQWKHLVSFLKPLVHKVYLAVRKDQIIDYPDTIEDKIAGLGPFGAIYSALEKYPKEAFLVLAVDVPRLDSDAIQKLILARDTTQDATAFKAVSKDYPEPLVCIWEPSAFAMLQSFKKQENYRPIQVLKQLAVKTLSISDDTLQNVNTFQEYQAIKKSKQE